MPAEAPVPDLLVVGGGPAGLAVAIRARQAGLAATVLDRSAPPIDKPCGEGLMPDGLARLAELGVSIPPGAGAPLRGIRYLEGDVVAQGEFRAPGGRAGSGGLGVRRTVLHGALVERAGAAGVELRWQERVTGLVLDDDERPGVATGSGIRRGRILVGADGLRSQVRRWAGLEGRPVAPERARFGVRRHYRLEPWTDRVEVHWGDGAEAYVTPVGPDLVGVALLWHGETSGFDELLARFPGLARRLAGASHASRDRGCGPLHQRVRHVTHGRLALVGDASGYVDAITGEGLSLAFHHAFALVEAARELLAGRSADLRDYARDHRRIGRVPEALIHLLLAIERRPRLRRRTLRALASDPALFDRLLAVHARTAPVSEVGLTGALRLVWRLASNHPHL